MAKFDRWLSLGVHKNFLFLSCRYVNFLKTSHTHCTVIRAVILFRMSDGIYRRKAVFIYGMWYLYMEMTWSLMQY